MFVLQLAKDQSRPITEHESSLFHLFCAQSHYFNKMEGEWTAVSPFEQLSVNKILKKTH